MILLLQCAGTSKCSTRTSPVIVIRTCNVFRFNLQPCTITPVSPASHIHKQHRRSTTTNNERFRPDQTNSPTGRPFSSHHHHHTTTRPPATHQRTEAGAHTTCRATRPTTEHSSQTATSPATNVVLTSRQGISRGDTAE